MHRQRSRARLKTKVLAHPEAFGLDPIADRLFAPWHVVLIK